MSDYPGAIYEPRTKENKPGVVYDPLQTTKLFAEDVVYDDNEIVAIEEELGLNPKGAFDSVAEFLQSLLTSVGTIVTTFLGLSDTPSSYTGQELKALRVNAAANAIEFVDFPNTAVAATGAEINTGSNNTKFATPLAIADSNLAFLSDIPSVPVKATGAEINTGTDDAKFATAKAIADSNIAFLSDIPSVDVGGVFGINTETLSAGKTLTAGTSEIYQRLNPNGADRIITLATSGLTAGRIFNIRNTESNAGGFSLQIKQSSTTLDWAFSGDTKSFIFDGTNWQGISPFTGGVATITNSTNFGYLAKGNGLGCAFGRVSEATLDSVAMGYGAQAYTYSVCLGKSTHSLQYGVAIGYQAEADSDSISIGYNADILNKSFSIALGKYSIGAHDGGTAINITGGSGATKYYFQVRLNNASANATPINLLCAGIANSRITVRASSCLAFHGIINARDRTSGDCAAYEIKGAIKRDGSNNTVLVGTPTVTVLGEDDASWDVAVTADNTNEALQIAVTGDATNVVDWAGVLDMVQVAQ